MQEFKINAGSLPPPPGIIGSFVTGFEAVAAHIPTILLPLGLDLFLWLGPRLQLEQAMRQVGEFLTGSFPAQGPSAEQAAEFQDTFAKLLAWLQTFNGFSTLRTFPIGIFSLMARAAAPASPFNPAPAIQVDSGWALLGWLIASTLIGWIAGGLYFRWVASIVAGNLPLSAGRTVVQTLFYSMLWSLLAALIGLPVFAVMSLLAQASPDLAQAVVLVLAFVSMWFLVPLFFSPHGIYVKKQNALVSILESMQMARFTLPSSSLFVMSLLIIGAGMNLLWKIPQGDSWLTLVGLFGHAFITTALLASSFVYYRDMTAWLQMILQRLRAGMPPQPV